MSDGSPRPGDHATGDRPTPTDAEQALVDAYELLVATLREHGDELPPFAARNAIRATAALWQVVNGLGLEPGQLYDIGA